MSNLGLTDPAFLLTMAGMESILTASFLGRSVRTLLFSAALLVGGVLLALVVRGVSIALLRRGENSAGTDGFARRAV